MIVGQLVRIYTFEMPQNDILEPDHDSYDLLDPFLFDPRKESLDPLIPEDTFLDSLFLSFVDEFLLLLLLLPSLDAFCRESVLPYSRNSLSRGSKPKSTRDIDIDISPVGISSDGDIFCCGATVGWVVGVPLSSLTVGVLVGSRVGASVEGADEPPVGINDGLSVAGVAPVGESVIISVSSVGEPVSRGCAVGVAVTTTGIAVGRLLGASVGAPLSEIGQTPL
jgi:hypothetical protein